MEMGASEDVGIGEDLTPPLAPLASVLYDSALLSHCSSCFSPLSPQSFPTDSHPDQSLRYCSSRCSTLFSSAEGHLLLLRSHLPRCYADDTSDLRAALRLLHLFRTLRLPLAGERVGGLLTNRAKLDYRRNSEKENDDEVDERIREGARAMAMARSLQDGAEFSRERRLEEEEEEAALCIVLTNAVEVQGDGGRGIGIAVYDAAFSWINHSCSPNACYRFLKSSPEAEMLPFSGDLGFRITPGGQHNVDASCEYGELRRGDTFIS